MIDIYKQTQGTHRIGFRVVYFRKALKERVPYTREEAEDLASRGEATIRNMRPGNRKGGPKSKSFLMPKRYKSLSLAVEAAEELARTTPFSECMVFTPIRCVDTLPDRKPEELGGRYNWRVRRSFTTSRTRG